jgi:hypothetical protein
MQTIINNTLQIPYNHNVVGTCSKCGGPIIQSILWAGTDEPTKYCMNCSKVVKQKIDPIYGPILEVE